MLDTMFANNNSAIIKCRFVQQDPAVIIQTKHRETRTVEKGRVDDTSTYGQGQSQLPNGLKEFRHDSNLVARQYRVIRLTQVL